MMSEKEELHFLGSRKVLTPIYYSGVQAGEVLFGPAGNFLHSCTMTGQFCNKPKGQHIIQLFKYMCAIFRLFYHSCYVVSLFLLSMDVA